MGAVLGTPTIPLVTELEGYYILILYINIILALTHIILIILALTHIILIILALTPLSEL